MALETKAVSRRLLRPATAPFTYISTFILAYIDEVEIRLGSEYMQSTFDSCKKVAMPSTGGLVVDTTCGERQAVDCTPEL